MKKSHQEKLAEVGMACISWFQDTQDCHFCNPELDLSDCSVEPNYVHDPDCFLLELFGQEYFDNLDTMEDVLE